MTPSRNPGDISGPSWECVQIDQQIAANETVLRGDPMMSQIPHHDQTDAAEAFLAVAGERQT
ncbi:MAG: hypothetical protein M3Q71_19930, partial [Chloroflexota bacterium]|nr:hypothetical protein [Chloroflexota bacterium]